MRFENISESLGFCTLSTEGDLVDRRGGLERCGVCGGEGKLVCGPDWLEDEGLWVWGMSARACRSGPLGSQGEEAGRGQKGLDRQALHLGSQPRSTGPQCAGKPSLYFWEYNSPHFPSYLTFSLLRPSGTAFPEDYPRGVNYWLTGYNFLSGACWCLLNRHRMGNERAEEWGPRGSRTGCGTWGGGPWAGARPAWG